MNQGLTSELLAHVTRGPLIESIHRGHIAVIDINQRIHAFAGDPQYYGFVRSAAKPLQAIPLLEGGGQAALGLTDEQTALLCASHNGEEAHVMTARSILQTLDLDESALQCGIHEPYYKPAADQLKQQGLAPTLLHNNCSGKHAGMLALALVLGASIENYTSPAHPVQQNMLSTVSEMSDVPIEHIQTGTDGCGVPVFAMPLAALALAYARLGSPDGLSQPRSEACRNIVKAIRSAPFYVAGTERYDTALAEVTKGRIIGKMGAEAVFAAAVPGQGWGLAVKIEDGSLRALYPVVTEALTQLGWLTSEEAEQLAPYHEPLIRNCRGEEVGRIRPVFRLQFT